MRWTPGHVSQDVEDRRGRTLARRGLSVGLGGVLLLFLLSLLTGRNFMSLLDSPGVVVQQPMPQSGPAEAQSPQERQLVEFVSSVLDDTQAFWNEQLAGQYRKATLVLFRDLVQSACGMAQAATGPFYCPADEKVYIDLGFYDELQRRFGAPGDFAQAYVLAHEIGHHVQKVLGVEAQVRELQQRRPDLVNPLSVRMELQADCFAGVWGRSTAGRQTLASGQVALEEGDIEEGINAAAAIGDDRIQRQTTGFVRPDSFTHGSSAQRVEWFRRGLQSGDVKACDTFNGS
jgi:predicted metalloprotease